MTHKLLSQDNKRSRRGVVISFLLILVFTVQIPLANASLLNVLRRKDLSINLEDGVKTDAQITYPSIGYGPFPIVLLVPGGGLTDMDEYIPASVTVTGKPSATMKQIAEYLSERGFMVLRYNKRGVTRNATMTNYTIYSEATVNTFKADAETALSLLKNNPMADNSDITVIGHSESSIIVTRMAEDDPSISKVVIMGASARDYLVIKHTQIVELRILFAEQVLDLDNDRLVYLDEAIKGLEPYENSILPKSAILMGSGNETSWIPTWDPNGDGLMNITGEYIPVLERIHLMLSNLNYPGYNQTQAHMSWGATMDMIGDLPSSILILQGEGDWQTPLIEALLLEQALTDAGHMDHTLYTYPGLSHFFYPTDGWEAAMGPMEQDVLHDLYQWMVSSERGMDQIDTDIEKNSETIQSLENELVADIEEVNQSLTDSLTEIDIQLEQQNKEGGITFMTPVFTVILVLLIVTMRKRREN
jgi:pimeloyl-ACP methyl ester carboxylesterase